MRWAPAGPHLRHVGVLLGHHEARGVERPADLVGQEALGRGDGVVEPPQVPHLHQSVLARRQQQVAGRDGGRRRRDGGMRSASVSCFLAL